MTKAAADYFSHRMYWSGTPCDLGNLTDILADSALALCLAEGRVSTTGLGHYHEDDGNFYFPALHFEFPIPPYTVPFMQEIKRSLGMRIHGLP